jgi:hypothetical protein
MGLHSAALVWRLRQAVKRRVRKSKNLRHRGQLWHRNFTLEHPAVYEPILIIFLASTISIHYPANGTAWLFACLTLYCTATAVMRSRQLQSLMTISPERFVFQFYPLSDRHFFRWSLERFLWKTARIWLASGVAFAFVFEARNEPWLWKSLAFATLQWLITLAAILVLASYTHGIPRWVPLSLYAAMIFVFYVGSAAYVAPVYPVFMALPAGWIDLAVTTFHGRILEWIAILMLLFLAAGGVWALILKFRSQIVIEAAPDSDVNTTHQPSSQELGLRSDEDEMEELLEEEEPPPNRPQTEWQKLRLQLVGSRVQKYTLSGDWLAARNWTANPWLERIAIGWLNQDERKAAEFLLGETPPRWNELWRASVIVAAVAGALLAMGIPTSLTLGMAAAALSALIGLPVLGGGWPATSPARLSGKLSPMLGCYPLDYRIACRAMWKINLVRAAAWLPVGALMGALMGFGFGSGPGPAAWLVVKGVLLYAASIPLLSAGHFSKSTNDTSNLRLATLPMVVAQMFLVVLFVTAAVTTLALPAAWALVSLATSSAISLLAWRLYGFYYERGQVDLLRQPK